MWERTRTTFVEAVERLTQAAARVLPGILAMLLLVAISCILAAVAGALVRRLSDRLEVDRRLREWGMAAPASGDRLGPSRLAARVVFWTIVAVGVLLGLGVLEMGASRSLATRLLDYVPHALVGLAVLAAGLAASRALERSVLIGAVNMGLHSARLLGLGARWLLVVLAGAMALEELGIGGSILTAAFAILFGGIVLSLALAIGLGAKDVVAHSLERRLQEPSEKPPPAPGEKTHHL